jgi:methylated-DNA-[protein]-cysteine S-methyltransferase
MKLYYAVLESKIGRILVTRTDKGLNNLLFHQPTWGKFFEELKKKKNIELVRDENKFSKLKKELNQYLSGKKAGFTEKLDLSSGTLFQQKVWKKMLEVPFGKTISYKKLAAMVGSPKKARAVGNACATNPVSIIVPCHRTIKSDGGLGGYGGGIELKKRLLKLEKST